ncbi:hypothetical protein V6N13_053957 [Hibiscus sabdariffa]
MQISGKAGGKNSGIVKNVAYYESNPGKKSKAVRSMAHKAVVIPMVEGQEASVVEHANHSKVHVAVSIFVQSHGKVGLDGIISGKSMGGKVKGSKENVRQGLKICKPSDMRTISRPVLSEWVDNMNSQPDSIAMDKEWSRGFMPGLIN